MINNNNNKNDNYTNYINHDDEDDDEYGNDTRPQREAQRYNNQRLCTTVLHVRETRDSKRARTIKLRMQLQQQRPDIDQHVFAHAPRALPPFPRHLEHVLVAGLRRDKEGGGVSWRVGLVLQGG